MLNLNIQNETSRLRAVILGTAYHNGPSPSLEQCYDPKSKMHVKAGTYPSEQDMIIEMQSLANVFDKYNVSVCLGQKSLRITIKFFLEILVL